jgi:hypothetical protein
MKEVFDSPQYQRLSELYRLRSAHPTNYKVDSQSARYLPDSR